MLYRISKNALKVFDSAMKANSENDEETVYIYLMRYCELVHIMNKIFKSDAEYIVPMHSSNLKKSVKILTHIKESLENR